MASPKPIAPAANPFAEAAGVAPVTLPPAIAAVTAPMERDLVETDETISSDSTVEVDGDISTQIAGVQQSIYDLGQRMAADRKLLSELQQTETALIEEQARQEGTQMNPIHSYLAAQSIAQAQGI